MYPLKILLNTNHPLFRFLIPLLLSQHHLMLSQHLFIVHLVPQVIFHLIPLIWLLGLSDRKSTTWTAKVCATAKTIRCNSFDVYLLSVKWTERHVTVSSTVNTFAQVKDSNGVSWVRTQEIKCIDMYTRFGCVIVDDGASVKQLFQLVPRKSRPLQTFRVGRSRVLESPSAELVVLLSSQDSSDGSLEPLGCPLVAVGHHRHLKLLVPAVGTDAN